MPYGITQCYLPPSWGEIPALTPDEAGTGLSDPGGMQGWVHLVGWIYTEIVYPKTVTRPLVQVITGPMWINFVHATNAANHYATLPTTGNVLYKEN